MRDDAFNRERAFPEALFGPVLRLAFARLASSCLFVAIVPSFWRPPGPTSCSPPQGADKGRDRLLEGQGFAMHLDGLARVGLAVDRSEMKDERRRDLGDFCSGDAARRYLR